MTLLEQIGAEWSIWSGFAGTLEVMNAIQHVRTVLCLIGSVCRFHQHIPSNKYEFKISKWHKLFTKQKLMHNWHLPWLHSVVSGKLEICLSYHFSKLSLDTKVTQVTSWHLPNVSPNWRYRISSNFSTMWYDVVRISLNMIFMHTYIYIYIFTYHISCFEFFSSCFELSCFYTRGVRSIPCLRRLMSFWPRCGTNLDGISERRPRAVATPHAALRRRNLRFTSRIQGTQQRFCCNMPKKIVYCNCVMYIYIYIQYRF